MSGTALNRVITAPRGSDMLALINQVNLLMASVDGIAAKLDADAGVTDTNYASLWTTQYSQIKTASGATVTDP
jgi:hypothetical protein